MTKRRRRRKAEAVKREDVKAIFPNATDEEIDSLLNKVGDELNPLKRKLKNAEAERDETKASLVEAQASESDYKRQLDEANAKLESGMSDEERLAQREKAAEEREREFTLKSNSLDAKAIFVEAGCFDEADITGLVEQVTSEDGEETKARAKRIVDTVSKQRAAVKQETEDALLRGNPKPNGGGGNSDGAPTTLKDFLALSDAEQIALKEADPTILSQLK
ncbi:hypothetical protein [Adlercreutzia sp. ZJ242]|uniref:hypothetical protein n=1 Tax=Adlercreutzia sp. ZJ242 TaxID=2709409 RepID=UPI0013EE36B4|nr:hypothetical protein [Adlercreutzia sp. ZJ242]